MLTRLRSGYPHMIEYTPASGNLSAGDVVLVGNTAGWCCGIAHKDIVNNTVGELAIYGGIYEVIALTNMAAGAKCYWDGTNKVTATSTNNALFGFTVTAMGAANTNTYVQHMPFV